MTFTLTMCERRRCGGLAISETSVTVKPRNAKGAPVTFAWKASEATTETVEGFRRVGPSDLTQVDPPSPFIESLCRERELPVYPSRVFEASERMGCCLCDAEVLAGGLIDIEENPDGMWRSMHHSCWVNRES